MGLSKKKKNFLRTTALCCFQIYFYYISKILQLIIISKSYFFHEKILSKHYFNIKSTFLHWGSSLEPLKLILFAIYTP